MATVEPPPENEAPAAIKALGPLFKLTQVYLWDDDAFVTSSSLTHKDSYSSANQNFHHNATSSNPKSAAFKDFAPTLEDMELIQQMNELGLPVSFNTSKKGSVISKAKRKGIKLKPKAGNEVDKIQGVEAANIEAGEVASLINIHDTTEVSLCCVSTLARSETSYSEIAEEVGKSHCSSNGGSVIMGEVCEEITSLARICGDEIMINGNTDVPVCPIDENGETSLNNAMEEKFVDNKLAGNRSLEGTFMACDYIESEKMCVDSTTEERCIPDSCGSSQSSIVTDNILKDEYEDCKQCGDFGDWRAFWDSFYMRNYFYNIKTHESTWYPPPGAECIGLSEAEPKPNDQIIDTAKNDVTSGFSSAEVLDPCDLQNKSYFVDRVTNFNNLSIESFHGTSSRVEPDAGSAISGLDLPAINCSYQDSDELDGVSSFSEMKKSPNGEAHLYSVSNTRDDVDSYSYSPLESEEALRHKSQTLSNRIADELDADEQLSKLEVISCEEDHKVCEMCVSKVADSVRSIGTIPIDSEVNWNEVQLEYVTPVIGDLQKRKDPIHSKKKKKMRRKRIQKRISEYESSDYSTELQLEGMPEKFPADIVKYWCQRYSLFSRFDDGIKMDEEGWFSVTPEPIAIHHAARCGGGIVIDSFTGMGGNAIQLAKRGNHVIAIDIDPQKIEFAQHNACIYGVDGNIDFIKGDFFQLPFKMKADTVFLSPPWGGPDYAKVQTYNIKTMLKPHDGYFLFHTSRGFASKIVMFLPRNVDLDQLAELSLSVHPPWRLEVEKNFLNGKLKAVTAYFSDTTV